MSFQQLSKLFMRGRAYTEKMKEFSDEELQEIDDIIIMVYKDPLLQKCKAEFCNALARTIKNEYCNLEVGEQDYRVAIMRGAVTAKLEGKMDLHSDPIQRKKWYQTWVFNYLRQILRENKIPIINNKITKIYSLETLAMNTIVEDLDKYEVEKTENGYIIRTEHTNAPIIMELKEMYLNKLEINVDGNSIIINRMCEQAYESILENQKQSIHEHHIYSEDGPNSEIESKISEHKENNMVNEQSEVITKLYERIPDDAHPILAIYVEDSRPPDYVQKYGNRPHIAHISEYLSMSPKDVRKLINTIKIHMRILELGY